MTDTSTVHIHLTPDWCTNDIQCVRVLESGLGYDKMETGPDVCVMPSEQRLVTSFMTRKRLTYTCFFMLYTYCRRQGLEFHRYVRTLLHHYRSPS